jgi:hypothetical protein
MEVSETTQMLISILIFAPGLVMLAALSFIGLLLVAEKSGLFGVSTGKKPLPKTETPVHEATDTATVGPTPAHNH